MHQRYKQFLIFFILILLLLLVGFETVSLSFKKHNPLEVHFLDIGQGDATLVQYLGSYQILIDGGPNGKKLLSELSKVMPATDRTIEIVIMTHPDKDHFGGLIDAMKAYSVKIVLCNGQEADTEIFRQYKKVIEEQEIKEYTLGEGSKISIGKKLDLRSFNPDVIVSSKSDRNEHSIVIRMDYGENSFLFTGDADSRSEADMLEDQEDVNVDWLKVGHHGSKHSTTENFIKKVTPEYAIISCGKNNRYGHPHEDVLGRLRSRDVEVLRTDTVGTILVECFDSRSKCSVR
ncbi:MAG: ComEC/Rec2 family competence protein [Patescibacteria group bacterium]|nr:ComEC/Rec2 family competence protein [Patescibacteria group bacterium]